MSITEKIAPWLNAAIEAHGMGENILWEPAVLPDQQGQPAYTVMVWMPGGVLGTIVNGSVQIHDILNVDAETIDEIMADFLRALREARSQQIAPNPTQQPPAPQRGSQTPSGLLIG